MFDVTGDIKVFGLFKLLVCLFGFESFNNLIGILASVGFDDKAVFKLTGTSVTLFEVWLSIEFDKVTREEFILGVDVGTVNIELAGFFTIKLREFPLFDSCDCCMHLTRMLEDESI